MSELTEVINKILKRGFRYQYLGKYYADEIYISADDDTPAEVVIDIGNLVESVYHDSEVNVVFEDKGLPRPRNKYYGIAYIDAGNESVRITYGKIGDDVHCATIIGVSENR